MSGNPLSIQLMPTKAPLPKEEFLHSIETTFEAKAIRIELEELYGL